MEYRCTGVGLVYLHRLTLATSAAPRSTSSNVAIGSGTASPVASTGMSSYASKLMPVFSPPNRVSGEAVRISESVRPSMAQAAALAHRTRQPGSPGVASISRVGSGATRNAVIRFWVARSAASAPPTSRMSPL